MVVEKNTWLVRWEHVDGTIRVTNTIEKTKEEAVNHILRDFQPVVKILDVMYGDMYTIIATFKGLQ
tara:strand:- start:260 stop:457 length:198 start_codon:yes stop_codon:yes gene_type:complete